MLLAIVSGVVLYAPFMRKLRFGEVRRDRSTRVKWLDLHNLLGIVTLTWAFVVGGHRHGQHLGRPRHDVLAERPDGRDAGALQRHAAVEKLGFAGEGLRGRPRPRAPMKIGFIAFPGTAFSSEHHYGVFMRGNARR